jgi:hypothetical protein
MRQVLGQKVDETHQTSMFRNVGGWFHGLQGHDLGRVWLDSLPRDEMTQEHY